MGSGVRGRNHGVWHAAATVDPSGPPCFPCLYGKQRLASVGQPLGAGKCGAAPGHDSALPRQRLATAALPPLPVHSPASVNLALASSTSGFQSRPPAARRMLCSYLALPCCSKNVAEFGKA